MSTQIIILPNNLGIDPFSNPGNLFETLGHWPLDVQLSYHQFKMADCELVPPAMLGWYYFMMLQNVYLTEKQFLPIIVVTESVLTIKSVGCHSIRQNVTAIQDDVADEEHCYVPHLDRMPPYSLPQLHDFLAKLHNYIVPHLGQLQSVIHLRIQLPKKFIEQEPDKEPAVDEAK